MTYRNALTDLETMIVRETPEAGWDDETRREAQARLPIDLPAIDDDGADALRPIDLITLFDLECAAVVFVLTVVVLVVLL